MIVHQPEKRDIGVRGQPGVAVTGVAGQPMAAGTVNAMGGVAGMAPGGVATATMNAGMGAPMQGQLQPGMQAPPQNVVPGMQMNMANMAPMSMAQMTGQATTAGHEMKYDR